MTTPNVTDADLDAILARLVTALESETRRLLEYQSLSTKDICMDCNARGADVDVRAFENHSPECAFREVWRQVDHAARIVKEAEGGRTGD